MSSPHRQHLQLSHDNKNVRIVQKNSAPPKETRMKLLGLGPVCGELTQSMTQSLAW